MDSPLAGLANTPLRKIVARYFPMTWMRCTGSRFCWPVITRRQSNALSRL
jgi:hypothetical protein